MRLVFLFLFFGNAHSITGLEIPYLIEILSENIKRYEQLRQVVKQGEDSQELLRVLNEGIDNATGLMQSLPIKDQKILQRLRRLQSARDKIKRIYGTIPKGSDEALFRLHDESVSRAFEMVDISSGYAKIQEQNAHKVFRQAKRASPKGAQRMTAQMSAQILHALNQLIRINAQILQLQSEQLALNTKEGKDMGRNFNKIKEDMDETLGRFKDFPRFSW